MNFLCEEKEKLKVKRTTQFGTVKFRHLSNSYDSVEEVVDHLVLKDKVW